MSDKEIIKKLQEEKAAVLQEAEAAKLEATALREVVEPMAEELKALKANPAVSKVPSGTFRHQGTEYGFNFPNAILPGKGKITVEDVLADKALQAKLVKLGSGMLKKIEKQ